MQGSLRLGNRHVTERYFSVLAIPAFDPGSILPWNTLLGDVFFDLLMTKQLNDCNAFQTSKNRNLSQDEISQF